MPTNDGVMFFGCRDNCYVEIYYDNTQPASPDQPIVDRAGVALRAVNLTGQPAVAHVTGPSGRLLGGDGQADINVPEGETTFTAAQLARPQVRIRTRGDITIDFVY